MPGLIPDMERQVECYELVRHPSGNPALNHYKLVKEINHAQKKVKLKPFEDVELDLDATWSKE